MMNSRERRKAEAEEHNKKRDLLEQYSKLRREIALNNNTIRLPHRMVNANSRQLQQEVDKLQSLLETMVVLKK